MLTRIVHVICLFIFVILIFFFSYRKIENFFVFFPDASIHTIPSDWQLECQAVEFSTEDRVILQGWFFPLKEETPVILFCHGNAGNMSHRLENIRLLLQHNLQVFIFDYRGYGKSEGNPSEAGLYQDGQAAYDFMVNTLGIHPEKIVLFGRSLGAAVAVDIAIRRDIKAIVIESGFTSTRDMARTVFLFKYIAPLLPAHFNNLEKITHVTNPKLIIHGEKDLIVPFAMGRKLFETAPKPKYFFPLKRAGHNNTWVIDEKIYFETLATFARDSKI